MTKDDYAKLIELNLATAQNQYCQGYQPSPEEFAYMRGTLNYTGDPIRYAIEQCAKIAEGQWMPWSNAFGEEYLLRKKIAEEIRALKP